MQREKCPCCGFPTLGERGNFEICELCHWEDDGQFDPYADEVWGGPNGDHSLTEARKNFKENLIMYRDKRNILSQTDTEIETKRALLSTFVELDSETNSLKINALWNEIKSYEKILLEAPSSMEIKVVLLYGEELTSLKHIEKITNKYYKYYLSDTGKGDFNKEDYYEIWIEERNTGLKVRNRHYTPTVPVKKEFLPKFLNIFRTLKGNMCLCKPKHEHPIVEISGVEYEGDSFYIDDGQEKIVFYDKHWIKVDVNEDTEKVLTELISSQQ
ncbi:CPCC family cysteine-rich protein [Peribacillus sp. ACCC06369]|uniref:CPCC family cysteine-rich protein n=1 Tax=Peribacillus sp. ACCC06369 TaxID=3055860 RepID=UPI0025A00804|nr:CPCC family cysteine-rich protein [Peribacillus sp. ACCC06369]MDM5360682.1 CPCC family cysteine-rich protein [Peribacillus sp. ACCC06369]